MKTKIYHNQPSKTRQERVKRRSVPRIREVEEMARIALKSDYKPEYMNCMEKGNF